MLEVLRAGDPSDGAIGGLEDAASVILFSVNVTDDLLDGELDGEEPTPTALPTFTPTYVTPTPAATATPAPSDTTEVEENPAPEEGADTQLWLATSEEVEGVTGKYFVRRQDTRSSAISYDRDVARRLWDISAQMVGLAA